MIFNKEACRWKMGNVAIPKGLWGHCQEPQVPMIWILYYT